MNIIEQAEHELHLLMLCKPSTVRGLIEEIQRLRKAIETHRDAEGGGIHTYSWYDNELYKALGEQE